MKKCPGCGSNVEPVLSFGRMPIANGFLLEKEFSSEFFFDLSVGFCPRCSLVQLMEVVEPETLFHENYAYFASTSARMVEHFQGFAAKAQEWFPDRDNPFVVEIGSNDGILLQNFSRDGIRHLGVEPSANVAQEATRNGIDTMCSFFDRDIAARILQEHGPADAVVGANVFSHIPDIHSVFAGIKLLLKEGGAFIFEEPYLAEIIEKTAYDQFYDEHFYYYCLSSLDNMLAQHGMVIVDAEPQQVHGGSMRYFAVNDATRPSTPRVAGLRSHEASLRLDQKSTYHALQDRISKSREELVKLLQSVRADGKRVVGYGATSKSTTMTNFCSIGPELVEFISDTTPTKQGKFSPGTHIPVRPYKDFEADYPDYALLLAWNHREEILAKEQRFMEQGGKFITFVPRVGIIG